jgi:hypothetical protein
MQPRVREVIEYYVKGGLLSVDIYLHLPIMDVDPSTWCGQIKKSLEENRQGSVTMELELIKEKFNFYKDVSKEESSGAGTDSVDGKGDKAVEGQISEQGRNTGKS